MPEADRRETLDAEFTSAYIVDTRKLDGAGISKQVRPSARICLFTSDLGDIERTNMLCVGMLPGDQTMRIERIRLSADFSNDDLFREFCRRGNFELQVSGKRYFASKADVLRENNPHTFTLETPLALPARQGFQLIIETDGWFAEQLLAAEYGWPPLSYIEIRATIGGSHTHSIL